MVKFLGFFAINGEEIGTGIVGPQRLEELLQDGMDTAVGQGTALNRGLGYNAPFRIDLDEWGSFILWVCLRHVWM